MAEEGGLDPFQWDVDRVVKELCTIDRTFDLPSARKLPAPETLKAALVESEVDGESLLTNDDLDKSHDLASMLGIKKIPQRNALQQIIRFLKTKSPEYWQWRQAQISQEQLLSTSIYETPQQSEDVRSSIASRDASLPVAFAKQSIEPPLNAEALYEFLTPASEATHKEPAAPCVGEKRQREPDLIAEKVPRGVLGEAAASEGQEPPKKKKRIAPVNLSSSRMDSVSVFIPTEADALLMRMTAPATPVDGDAPNPDEAMLYLGHSRVDPATLLELPEDDLDLSDHSIRHFKAARCPAGRRRAVHRVMKKYLRTRRLTFGTVGIVNPNSLEDVLPLFGDSDDEYDTETWEEIEEEEKERQKLALHPKKYLSADDVDGVIEESANRILKKWAQKKLPKLEQVGYRLWNNARRRGTRHRQVEDAKKFHLGLDARISKLYQEIRAIQWSKRKEAEQQMASVEPSLMQREEQTWIISLLTNPLPPPRPPEMPARSERRPRVRRAQDLSDEENLSSGSDGDVGDFIVDDEDEDQPSSWRSRPRAEDEDAEEVASEGFEPVSGPRTPSSTRRRHMAALPGTTTRHPILVPSSPAGALSASQTAKAGQTLALLKSALKDWGQERQNAILLLLQTQRAPSIRESVCKLEGDLAKDLRGNPLFGLLRLFHVYVHQTTKRIHHRSLQPKDARTFRRLHGGSALFTQMCSAIGRLESPQSPANGINLVPKDSPGKTLMTPSSNRQLGRKIFVDNSDDDHSGSEVEEEESPKRNRRPMIRDRAAAEFRDDVERERYEQQQRRQVLRERLARLEPMAVNRGQLIINESKRDDEAFIYVNSSIAERIKPHQLDGVRFMWDQVVAGDEKTRKGCLLAHTMGLGKTMQVITLLVAIAEASHSPDPRVVSQIPTRLRNGRTLVLCPPGLVDNWMDELLMWTPDGALGELTKVHATTNKQRVIRDWATSHEGGKDGRAGRGGVVLVGYNVFTKMVQGDPQLADILQKTADLVIADEAHRLKNPKSQVHAATSNFSTDSRIALTGSPLANEVGDYYAMINWVSPNFLGTPEYFRQQFSDPIKKGLFVDSHPVEKRVALRRLVTLKRVAAPKMHRMSIFSIKDELPVKREYILYVPLTDVQYRTYAAYFEGITTTDGLNSQARVWSFIGYLGSLLAHPKIFKAHLEGVKDSVQAAHAKAINSGSGSSRHKPSVGDDEDAALPQGLVSSALSIVNAVRDIGDVGLSWKMVLLSAILDEAKLAGDRVLVFSQSLKTLDFLEELFKQEKRHWARLDGETEIVQRQAAIKTFNSDEGADIYLISTRAGGIGLNLQGANRVVIFDFKFSPTDEQQAVGRAYRIGQPKPVFVYWLVVDCTFETVVHERSVFKMQLSSRVVDKKNPVPWSKRLGNYFAKPQLPEQHDLTGFQGEDPLLDALFQKDSLRGGISRIMRFETFEQEEREEELTVEDKQEVEQEVHKLMNGDNAAQPVLSNVSSVTLATEGLRPSFGTPQGVFPGGATARVPAQALSTLQPELHDGAAQSQSSVAAVHMSTLAAQPLPLSAPLPVPGHKGTGSPGEMAWSSFLPRQEPTVHAQIPSPVSTGGMGRPEQGLSVMGAWNGRAPATTNAGPGSAAAGSAVHSSIGRHPGRSLPMLAILKRDPVTPRKGAQPAEVEQAHRQLTELEQQLKATTYDIISNTHPDAQLSTPAQFMQTLEACLRQMGISGLALTDKVQALRGAVHLSANFGLAMLTGRLSAQHLAGCSKQEIEHARMAWDSMGMGQLLDEVTVRGGEPQEQTAVVQGETAMTPRVRGRDSEEVAALLRRRAGKPFKRPVRSSAIPTFRTAAPVGEREQSSESNERRPGDSAEAPIVCD